MPVGMVSLEGVAVRRNGGKPKLLVRTSRRQAAINVKKALQVLVNADLRENRRAAINKYTPYLVLGKPTSDYNRWIGNLIARLDEVLAAKA